MPEIIEINAFEKDAMLVKLAREIALDHYELGEILKRFGISSEHWDRISKDRYFITILTNEIAEWNAANNTSERSKLKAAALIEEWLPEAHKRLHDKTEALNAKVALATLVTKIAGLGVSAAQIEGGAEKFVVNINLGEQQRTITLNASTPAREGESELQALPITNYLEK